MHWSEPFIGFIRTVIPEIAAVPIYVLTIAENPTDFESNWMAVLSPLADLRAQRELESLGLWRGRGICIRVRDDFETWSPRCQFGTLLHEMAHAIEHLSEPDALCDADKLSPVAREMLDIGESELLHNEGISRNDLIREQHGECFIRFACHLHWRARGEMSLSAGDVQLLHKAYSLGPETYDDVVSSLAAELATTRNLDLRRLRSAPDEFMRLFQ